jgi:tetratricopeptide (TPR) repeat protein
MFIVIVCAAVLFGGPPSPAEKAIATAQAAIEKEPDKPEHYNAKAFALARRARETADPAYYDRAGEAIARSLELAPGNFEALKVKGWILLGRHEFAQALQLAKDLNRRAPDDVLVYGLLTDAHVELGNYKDAEEAAQWLLNIGRSSVPGLTRAAFLRELFGDIEGALELMNTAYQRIDPSETEDRAWTLTQIGHLLALTGKTTEAGGILDQALRLVPDYHYALAGLAKVRAAEGKRDEAVRLLERRYEIAPHPENLFDVGIALHRAGKLAKARVVLADFEKKALAESAGWDNANRELIAYYTDIANKPTAALRIASREITRRRDVHTLDAYAWALHRSGRHVEAMKQVEAALSVGTIEPRILYHAGAIALAVNRTAKAKQYLRRSLDTNPRSEVAADARRLLSNAGKTTVAGLR